MIVVVTTDDARRDGVIRLDDRDNFAELAVDAVGLSREAVTAVVVSTGAGAVDGDHLWIDVDFLRGCGRGTDEWNTALAAMVDYAAGKGWTDSGSGRVRAHIRWK